MDSGAWTSKEEKHGERSEGPLRLSSLSTAFGVEVPGSALMAPAPPRPGQGSLHVAGQRPDESSEQTAHFRDRERKEGKGVRWCWRQDSREGRSLFRSHNASQVGCRQQHQSDVSIPPNETPNFILIHAHVFRIFKVLLNVPAGHNAEVFKKLMGTSCKHKWREANDHERLWVVAPGHPIVAGLGEYVDVGPEEMYGEHFDVPPPETLVFVGWFSGGEVFRSGCCYTRGCGKIFYFQPGHQEMPTYHHPEIQRIIVNAVGWATPTLSGPHILGNTPALEQI